MTSMWEDDWEGARGQNVGLFGMEAGRAQGRGSKLGLERHDDFWGRRRRAEETEMQPEGGRRENCRE